MVGMGEDFIQDDNVSEISDFATEENFDIFDVLSERAYPRDIVTVYLDDGAAFELRKLTDEVDAIDGEPDQATVEAFNERLTNIRTRIDRSARTFHLAGVSSDTIKDAMTAADEHFESRKVNRKRADGSIIRELPKSAQDDFMVYTSAVMMALHVEKIVDPDGRQVVAPTPDAIVRFINGAPIYAVREVNQAIERLQVDARDFERSLDDGFFPKP